MPLVPMVLVGDAPVRESLHTSHDKGSKGFPGLAWLYWQQKIRGVLVADLYHEDWNGLKRAAVSAGVWLPILERVLIRNLPHGPWQGACVSRFHQGPRSAPPHGGQHGRPRLPVPLRKAGVRRGRRVLAVWLNESPRGGLQGRAQRRAVVVAWAQGPHRKVVLHLQRLQECARCGQRLVVGLGQHWGQRALLA